MSDNNWGSNPDQNNDSEISSTEKFYNEAGLEYSTDDHSTNDEVLEERDEMLEKANYSLTNFFFIYCLKVKSEQEIFWYVGKTRRIKSRLKQHLRSNLDITGDDYDIIEIDELEIYSAFFELDKRIEAKERQMESKMFLEKCEEYGPENVLGGK